MLFPIFGRRDFFLVVGFQEFEELFYDLQMWKWRSKFFIDRVFLVSELFNHCGISNKPEFLIIFIINLRFVKKLEELFNFGATQHSCFTGITTNNLHILVPLLVKFTNLIQIISNFFKISIYNFELLFFVFKQHEPTSQQLFKLLINIVHITIHF